MVVQQADSLLLSGIVLLEAWRGPSIPLVECEAPALFDAVSDGQTVEVDADGGLIRLL
jgi:predicted aconitase with swiveling domain